MLRHGVVACLASTLLLVACGSHDRAPSGGVRVSRQLEPISGGVLDLDRTSVVGVFITGAWGVCSGTLIAPNLVLTARHCVSPIYGGERIVCGQAPFGPPYLGSNVNVTTDARMTYSGQWYRGSEVIVPSEGNDTCGYDVALVILGSSIPAEVTTPYVPRIDIPPAYDEPYVAVGYGDIGSTDGDVFGSRMARADLEVRCELGDCGNYQIMDNEFRGETGICQGDSGGPALDLENKVIGVVSRGGDGCTIPIYGSVSAWGEWIGQGAMRAAEVGGYEPPRWAVTGSTAPEPEPPPVPEGAAQGEGCNASEDCVAGLLCAYETTPADSYCTAQCNAQTVCPAGLACTEFGVCLTPQAPAGDDGGCSIADGDRGPVKPVPWLVGVAVVAAGALRRRRRC